MGELARDDYLSLLDEVSASADDLRRRLAIFELQLRGAREAVASGRRPVEAILDMSQGGIVRARRELYQATRDLEAVVQRLRGMSIRLLLASGRSITDIARLIDVSPQMARRLVRNSGDPS